MRDRLLLESVPADRLEVVPNWFDGKFVVPSQRGTNALRYRWGLTGKFVVGYSGNFGRVHALDCIIDAARRLADRADILFLLIGNGAKRREIENAAKAANLLNVLFKEYVPRSELPLSLTLPDVHLVTLAPEFEGLVVPSKLYGAMAAGAPVINVGASDGEVASILQDGERFGTTVHPDDAAGLAEAIKKLADDAGLATAWGSAARREFERKFDKSLAIASWDRILEAAPKRP
jgi:glycosyltransferase involved in cell wall biosynthesis